MAKLTLSSIGSLLKEKRDSKNQGIREASKEIGISSATLSRIENGKLPDLESFSKICKWLHINPAEILDCKDLVNPNPSPESQIVTVHLRADKNMSSELAKALGEMIFATQAMIVEEVKEI